MLFSSATKTKGKKRKMELQTIVLHKHAKSMLQKHLMYMH